MKKLAFVVSVFACMACNESEFTSGNPGMSDNSDGEISVVIGYESVTTKAITDYTAELNEEKVVKNVSVLVFDRSTGKLNAFRRTDSVEDGYTFTVTSGSKTVYAVVNGPEMSNVKSLEQMGQFVDDLSLSDPGDDGFVMVGSVACSVSADVVARPVVVVKRLVSRVVLQKVTNNIPAQYGKMKIDCVYLGNANSQQSFAGAVSGKVNPDGYADAAKTKPVGKNGNFGSCPGYMYRSSTAEIASGTSEMTKYHMYCQPSDGQNMTCMYLLVTIDGSQYYYRVPLSMGLTANTTSSVELEITNLGAPLPPDGDMQRGEIVATVSIAGWSAGEKYEVEF